MNMFTESIRPVAEKNLEVLIEASEVAELGAIKPKGFGLLIKRKYLKESENYLMEESGLSGESFLDTHLDICVTKDENPYFALHYDELTKECSEYLCDFDITPWVWNDAGAEMRNDMLKTAIRIIADELKFPENWVNGIETVVVYDKEYNTASVCSVNHLDNGGISVAGIPKLEINPSCLTGDYFESNAAIYHEMIHMKQYACVDGINPDSITDIRLLDLIHDMIAGNGEFSSGVSRPFSSYELEASAQEQYFKYILKSVIQDRYS